MSGSKFGDLYGEGFYSHAQRMIEDPAYRNQINEEKRQRLENQEKMKQRLQKRRIKRIQQQGGMYSHAQLVNFNDDDDEKALRHEQENQQFDRTASEEYFSRAQRESMGRKYNPTFRYVKPKDEDDAVEQQKQREQMEADYTLLEEAPEDNDKGEDFPITGEGERAVQGTEDMTEIFNTEFKRMCHEKKFTPLSGYKPIAPPDYILKKSTPRKLKEIVHAEFNRMCRETKFATAKAYEPEHEPTHYAKTIVKVWKKCPINIAKCILSFMPRVELFGYQQCDEVKIIEQQSSFPPNKERYLLHCGGLSFYDPCGYMIAKPTRCYCQFEEMCMKISIPGKRSPVDNIVALDKKLFALLYVNEVRDSFTYDVVIMNYFKKEYLHYTYSRAKTEASPGKIYIDGDDIIVKRPSGTTIIGRVVVYHRSS